MRTVRVSRFEGPLDLLLQLIEAQELDITTVSLAEVTEQYLEALRTGTAIPPEELADFLVIAAKLLLIKSRLLLPGLAAPDDDTGPTLEEQLRLYRRFVAAARFVNRRFAHGATLYPRENLKQFAPLFVPPERVGRAELRTLFAEVLRRIEPILLLPQEALTRAVSLHEKITAIKGMLERHTAVNFHVLLRDAQSRLDIIITFLALLELVKQRAISVVQDDAFRDIEIQPINHETPTV